MEKDELKLYAFRPDGHGEYSFYVMARSEEDARAAIEKWRTDNNLEKDCSEMEGYYEDDGYYEMVVLGEGEVITNDNE